MKIYIFNLKKMVFTVGDLVRGNRDYFIALSNGEVDECEFAENGFEVLHSDGGVCYYGKELGDYLPDKFLEPVSDAPKFKYGEEIEVSDTGIVWYKEFFIAKRESKHKGNYLCTAIKSGKKFDLDEGGQVKFWRYARNIKRKITRKEVAEKFGVPEDFIFEE